MIIVYRVIIVAVISVLAGIVGYWQGSKSAETEHLNEVRKLEQDLAVAQAGVSDAYEKGKKNAESKSAAVVADLRAGNLRLQQRWAVCAATPAPSESDAAARDREESAGRIVRAAAECDAQVRGLQDLLLLERGERGKNVQQPQPEVGVHVGTLPD